VTEKGSLAYKKWSKERSCVAQFYFFIMAALRSRCGHYILQLWFLSFFLLVPFFAYSQRSQSGCLPYFDTRCGPSANLECMSEMCCTRLAEKYRTQRSPKNRHLRTIAELRRVISSQIRHVLTIGKKTFVKHQYLLHMSLQYGELRPTNGWDLLENLGHPSKFQRVSRLGFVTAPTSLNGRQPNFARCLAVSWAGILYIYFWGLLPRHGVFLGAKFTLRPSLALSYIGSVTARHSSSGRQRATRNATEELSQRVPPIFSGAATTFDIGPHSS